jgi:hypothetical protein
MNIILKTFPSSGLCYVHEIDCFYIDKECPKKAVERCIESHHPIIWIEDDTLNEN